MVWARVTQRIWSERRRRVSVLPTCHPGRPAKPSQGNEMRSPLELPAAQVLGHYTDPRTITQMTVLTRMHTRQITRTLCPGRERDRERQRERTCNENCTASANRFQSTLEVDGRPKQKQKQKCCKRDVPVWAPIWCTCSLTCGLPKYCVGAQQLNNCDPGQPSRICAVLS
jgi:hypothetical protein